MNKDEWDIIKRVEELTSRINDIFGKKTRPFLTRYPLLFTMLVIFGAVMISEGMKELVSEISFLHDHPFVMMLVGILVLIVTGTLYKKLKNKDNEIEVDKIK